MAALEDGTFKPELKPLVMMLNNVLADLFTEFISLKQRHWHIKGIVFKNVHEFFDEVTDEVLEWIDDVGEYVVSFGAIAVSSLPDIMSKSTIIRSNALKRDPESFLQNGLEAMRYLKIYFTKIADESEKVNEAGVNNLVMEFVTEIDKFIYKYQAYLDMP